MKSRYVRRILKLGSSLWDLVVSAAGCFVFTRGFSLVTIRKQESKTAESIRTVGTSHRPLVAVGAALFLLAFVVSEALAMVGVLRH